uniref:Uncharacterized protein n=1 Tax=Sphaerodactylus townsendi TaxID=933632 RepID=A0ACB8FLT3_9SAUR
MEWSFHLEAGGPSGGGPTILLCVWLTWTIQALFPPSAACLEPWTEGAAEQAPRMPPRRDSFCCRVIFSTTEIAIATENQE